MIRKPAFTMLELIFVIVIMGVLSKFGIELFAKVYQNYIYTNINNKLQNQSATTVEFITKRLSYRISESVIGRRDDNVTFEGIQNLDPSQNYRVLEWVQKDIDGLRGNDVPYWSGIADLDNSSATTIDSPETNTTAVNNLIKILSYNDSNITDAAIFFVGSNSDIKSAYGWNGTAVSGVGAAMHPIRSFTIDTFDGNFSGVDLYEYYQLSWTANAIALEDYNSTSGTYDLVFYYDYQPWNGDSYTDGKKSTLMQSVSTFQFRALGSMIKVQVCVKSNLTSQEHALCKEKTVF